MKNKEFYKLLKKNKFQANSGFTLTELLVGLVMSIFVIGALGFGLMTVLATSQSESSKVKARTENSRALDFISDEVRRARNIETNVTSTNASGTGGTFSLTNKTPVFALDISEISSRGKIVYYLQAASGTNWKGPQVLYRWGPPLNADGSYGTGAWGEQALIDGINNTSMATSELTSSCTSKNGTVTPATATGFYACTFLQDPAKAYDPQPLNANGTKNENYNPRNTAQLFLTGQTKTASGVNDSQTNDSQVVARARDTLANRTDTNNSVTWSVEGLGGDYKCKDVISGGIVTPVSWHMRTDFSNSATPNTDTNKVSWTQDPTSTTQAQPQPIEIKSDQPLTITSNPVLPPGVNATECTSSSASVPHRINFGKPKTFNGVCDASLGTGSCPTDAYPERVTDDASSQSREIVQFFKRGTQLQNYGTNALNQKTLGKFLYDKGWAIPVNSSDGVALTDRAKQFKIPTSQAEIDAYKTYIDSTSLTAEQKTAEKARLKLLGEDQRIIGFEVGDHADTTQPGFDLQDNIFVVTSDVFKRKFAPTCFSGGNCNPSTGKPNPTPNP